MSEQAAQRQQYGAFRTSFRPALGVGYLPIVVVALLTVPRGAAWADADDGRWVTIMMVLYGLIFVLGLFLWRSDRAAVGFLVGLGLTLPTLLVLLITSLPPS